MPRKFDVRDRVRVIAIFSEEPEVEGQEGDVCRVGDDGTVGVFLDMDGGKYPTTFYDDEIELIEPAERPDL